MKLSPLLYTIFCLIIAGTVSTYSQTVEFSYDDAGNRTSRTVELGGLKSLAVTDTVALKTDLLNRFKIAIYPNPTRGTIEIDLMENSTKDVTLSVLNTSGVIIIELPINTQRMTVDLTGYPSGTYFISIKGDALLKYWKVQKI
ncbi:MAG: T9SS type A sorting domain-containing protein [Bacteroidales bacterium]|nr:T9SS type A sorting domain-containing protein [Bacteroidales bacterium]